MWEYTDKVTDHFKNPRNVGAVENPDGDGLAGSLACGDALRLTFKLGEEKKIAEAKFQTFGCASAIASSSALTVMLIGKTVDEADQITNADIIDYLGDLPKQKVHCSVMGREALEAAIYNYRTGKTFDKKLDGEVICHCFGATDKEIEKVARGQKLTSAEEVANACKAGGGCGQCIPEIEEIINRVIGEEKAKTEEKPKLTQLQKIKLIEETIDRQVRPILRRDGGDLELHDVDGDKVLVKFVGACVSCPVSAVTLKDVVENQLREAVSDDIVVEAV
ncbi:Fe-S cluster assembly protein NifU [Pontiella sulfatireligans]|uniref:Nitrogen fixation protein NifU n=1 Tax=Pontiella sulfatireligans TaxID=2750658 RepID=A0A6C2UGV2_9BACT|nr:Fe-S cluster assembly protein NifU [Pontiella sulfatireligans]VGO18436.1 Iron-sulfur cluster assembly scaffold protein IscU [Pontiella sulfatireligans]